MAAIWRPNRVELCRRAVRYGNCVPAVSGYCKNMFSLAVSIRPAPVSNSLSVRRKSRLQRVTLRELLTLTRFQVDRPELTPGRTRRRLRDFLRANHNLVAVR